MNFRHPQPLELNRDPRDAARARQYVATACRGLLPDVAMNAQLMVSELFTNALEYGTGPITLCVLITRNTVRVEVSDDSDTHPVPRRPPDDDIHGRGLIIIERLARDWGVEPQSNGRGKVVWFALSTT
jgi:anti-sigma regulatory factor (Ser/Thr protein kinase)